jgi:uncharacterized membrane protein YfcA
VLLIDDLQRLNALKGVLAFLVNIFGVVIFVAVGEVAWSYAMVLAGPAWLGANVGVVVARRLSSDVLRSTAVAVGVLVAAVLFVT